MTLAFRWLFRLLIAGLVLGASALTILYWFASRSLPDYGEAFTVEGLDGPVEIVRDNANVPHIFASSDADVFFAQGFVHAQDRMWQMLLTRRAVQGRLSELFGARALRTDDLMRRLDLYGLARASVDVQDAETKAALEAYSAGVNAWFAEVNEGARGRGAPEFWLFEPVIAPWQPADSIAVIKGMALQLQAHVTEEVLRARVSRTLPNERLSDILPDAPGSGVAALPEYASLFPDLKSPDLPSQNTRYAFGIVPERGMAGASNAWAASPARSAAGGTLLAGDPHLGLSAPSIWYLARLELKSGGVIGGSFPGLPGIVVGRSDHVGWSLTVSYADDLDIFIEKLNPDNPQEVLTPGGYVPIETRPSIINVAGEAPVTATLRWSPNGPILPGTHFDLETITPPGHVAALAWTALTANDTSMTALLNLNRSQNVTEAIAATEGFIAPSLNLVMADREDIALKTVGALPRRAARHQTQGRMPAPGWLPENLWQGRLGYSANPEFMAPTGGILGNTNNKTIDRPFPLHVSHDWGDTQRVQRWQRLMQNREVHTRESFIEAQLDTVSVTARVLLPLVARDLWAGDDPAEAGTPERRRQDALDLLGAWNGEMNEHMPEPLIYATWMRALQEQLIADELGPALTAEFTHPEPIFIERVYRDVDGAAVWCDILQSAPIETCADIARRALDTALIWIDETYGGQLEALRWGDAHEARHDHAVLGEAPVLRWLVNIRQSTSGGDNTLMRGKTKGTDPDPFANIHAASYRGVYDFADPDSSVFIIPTGQSGHPLSRHYDDLGELWRRGEYIPMTLDPDLARAAAVGVTVLTPRER
ncbi:MAG: penicillin acylase family protein [Rhodobacteraceae bacterium]|nr:penicillin acylase family protein [Paracoccaceae bacterium]